jgi:pimeloyl-ACP methyl ester carboxylesterase
MIWRVVMAAFCVLALAGPAAAVSAMGHWEGELVREGQVLPISFDFAPSAEGARGVFSADRWRVMDYPLGSVELRDDHVAFVLGDDDAFDGKLTGDMIRGTFKGADGPGAFTLRRVAAPVLPYREIAVTFRNGDTVLSGTLALPTTPGKHPAVVIVHGSGGQTRWGTNRYIADRFARAGIAALAYDKRGSGQSTGDWRQASYDDLARDALAGLDLLAARPEVDAARIGIMGHSEGGLIAPLAVKLAPDKVDFIVAEDTAAARVRDQDLYRVTNDINAQAWSPADKAKALDMYALFLVTISGDRPYAEFAAASVPVKDQAWFQYLGLPGRENQLWKIYPLRANYDMSSPWLAVRRPTLLVYGERDALVPVGESLARLEAILDHNGAPYAAVIIPGAQHNLTIQPQAGQPFFWWRQAPGAIDTVVAWAEACTRHGPCAVRWQPPKP